MGINSPEHFMAIMGTVMNNCIFSELYRTNSASACLEQLEYSKSNLIVCDTWQTLQDKFLVNQHKLKALGITTAVLFSEFGELPKRPLVLEDGDEVECSLKVFTWTQFLKLGEEVNDRMIVRRMLK